MDERQQLTDLIGRGYMAQNIKVLIVDDDPVDLVAKSHIVKKEGYEVLTALNALECIDLARMNNPDLILMDVILSDIEGPDLCRHIKKDPTLKSTYVVLVSRQRMDLPEQAAGLDAGADGYIVSSLSKNELTAKVNSVVRTLKAERQSKTCN